MYKVFIDHKPIIFMENDGCDAKRFSVGEKKFMSASKKKLRKLMEDVSIESPLVICCKKPSVTFNSYFKGYKKIGAAGGIVHRKDKYLVIERNGLWDIPKGKIEKGEDEETAAIREVEEECGIVGPVVDRFLTTTLHVFKHKGKKALKTTHWYSMNYDGPIQTTPQLEEGISKVEWMSLSELFGIRNKTYGSINELLDVFEEQL